MDMHIWKFLIYLTYFSNPTGKSCNITHFFFTYYDYDNDDVSFDDTLIWNI